MVEVLVSVFSTVMVVLLSSTDIFFLFTPFIFLIVFSQFMLENEFHFNFYFDECTFYLILMNLYLVMLITVLDLKTFLKRLLVLLTLTAVLFFFCLSNMLMFFIFFELMLIPLFCIIILYGIQPERVKASRWVILYTMISSAPLLISLLFVIKFIYNHLGMVSEFFSFSHPSFNNELLLFLLLSFLVKIPMFLLHSWLPKAHVEAPLEGSMILAGVMLKVGLFGLIRMISIMPNLFYKSFLFYSLISISLVGSSLVSWLALSSDDVKMSVAFSSISHMNFVMCGLMSMKIMGLLSCILIMISHALCSCLLFFMVTEIYNKYHSRSILITKGAFSVSPLYVVINFVAWVMNMSVPPFVSFIAEILCFASILSVLPLSLVLIMVYILMNSVYSLFNYGIQSYSFSNMSVKMSNSSVFMLLIFVILITPLLMMFFFEL
uniref:NADH-ubiquinone oxidoreductase chain 4 n=1 Tax=Falcolipeurus quadripustulatus TaxID=2358485 RepID=A0A386B2G5_9NEOP|nr:NADH dehydrogenase subunit 4 [Falcolipeurus quadripustulatus]